MAMAFAIASGVAPQAGLYCAIVAGFLISALGGSTTQIGGPTGAFVVGVYGIVGKYGLDGLFMCTLMAGVLLVMDRRRVDLILGADNVLAIVDIWYPGTQGGAAVADLLFGDVAPGGKLPFSWPRTAGQIPVIYSHTVSHDPGHQDRRYWDEASTPLFPFGHGLSYGRFEYRALILDRNSVQPGQTVTVSVTLTHTTRRTGDEVVQFTIRPPSASTFLSTTQNAHTHTTNPTWTP